jgi:quercetin dioxygenase-like cupin family protein
MAETQPPPLGAVNLVALTRASDGSGPAWSHAGDELNVNLIVLVGTAGVAEHVNAEVEVLLVGVEGAGTVTVDGTPYPLRPGQALVVPRGARRAIAPNGARFAYLTCHRRRAGLWPANAARPGVDGGGSI